MHIKSEGEYIMNYIYHLENEPYNQISSGNKTVEFRLNDEKRQLLQVGDTIEFENLINHQMLKVKIIELYKKDSFAELINALKEKQIEFLKDVSIDDMVEQLRHFYSEEKEQQYGVLGIEFIIEN